MPKLKEFLRHNIFVILLFLITVIIFITNYFPDTFLLGWDNLSTEFNPLLGLKRSLFAGWQEHQSFGLTAGLSHATDILHSLFMLLLGYFLPLNTLRYIFHMLMLLVGSIGMYYLLCYMFDLKNRSGMFSFFGSFVGALFYIFNLGTIQIFALPHESFSLFFAFLPWLVFTFIKYVHSKGIFEPKYVFVLFLLNIIGSSFAFIQTLFVVYLLVLGCISLGALFEHKDKKLYLKKIIIAFLIIFVANSYWIFPQIYFISTSYKVVGEAKINQLATVDIFNRNKEKGHLLDFMKMEGFYFDSLDTGGNYLFVNWKNYFNNSIIYYLRFFPFLFIFLGLFKFRRDHLGFVFVFIICLIAIVNNDLVFTNLNEILRHNPFLNQIFRSPFTKFIVVYSFVGSYFFVNGIEVFIHLFSKKQGISLYSFFFLVTILLFVLFAPIFSGSFFSNSMRVNIPQEYFDLFNYFNSVDKNKRIALLPEHTHWGWFKYKWGYDGSGFIWYGIEQPIVSRTFDVWSSSSESYFWEVKDAIEDRDILRIENTLTKYNISYLIVDRNIQSISGISEDLQFDQVDYFLNNSKKIKKGVTFGNIDVYEFTDNTSNNFISVISDSSSVYPRINITDYDSVYQDISTYYADPSEPSYLYPFSNLTTVTEIKDKIWKIEETSSEFIVSAKIPDAIDLSKYNFQVPSDDKLLKFKIYNNDYLEDNILNVKTTVIGNTISVHIPKIVTTSTNINEAEIQECNNKIGYYFWDKYDNSLHLKSSNRGSVCLGYNFPLLQHWNSYLVKIDVENKTGITPFIYIIGNKKRQQAKVEENLNTGLNYIILTPGYFYDDGYLLQFQNNSFLGITSENILHTTYIYLFPFEYLKKLRFEYRNVFKSPDISQFHEQGTGSFIVQKINYFTYKIKNLNLSSNSTIYLNQSYDKGWLVLCNRELCKAKHVVVNNWANGWVFEGPMPKDITVIFWPQYLEYLGLVLLLVPFWWIFKHRG